MPDILSSQHCIKAITSNTNFLSGKKHSLAPIALFLSPSSSVPLFRYLSLIFLYPGCIFACQCRSDSGTIEVVAELQEK